MKWPLSLVLMVLLFAGCTNNPPQVKQVWWLPVLSLNRDGSHIQRELMLYVHAQDEEGEADLAELRLEKADREILWKIDSTLWSLWETRGETWVGSSRIMGISDYLSHGEYRLVLEDRGGRTGEVDLYLEGWPTGELALEQKITPLGGGEWMIESSYDNWMILNSQGEITPCPVNTPFVPSESAGAGEYFFVLFNRESMWQLRRGPYTN